MSASTTTPKCNTLITNGFSLYDLPVIRESVREAARLQEQSSDPVKLPTQFSCSHCGDSHSLTQEELGNALFNFPSDVDPVATRNELNFDKLIAEGPAKKAVKSTKKDDA